MKNLFERYKGVIAYLFFGVCTTVVNIISYYICARWLCFSIIQSTIAAWLLAVIFAYVTNKLFVFKSCSWNRDVIVKEAASFFACRIVTGVLDILIMHVGVNRWKLYDVGVKIFSNVWVIAVNYIVSRWIVFKEKNLYSL